MLYTADEARPAVDKLLNLKSEEQLYTELGMRLSMMGDHPELGDSFDLPTEKATFAAEGWGDLFRVFGKGAWEALKQTGYDYVCGEKKDEIEELVTAGEGALTAALAAFIATGVGIAPAIAAVLAAIVVKLVWKSVEGGVCAAWKEALPASS